MHSLLFRRCSWGCTSSLTVRLWEIWGNQDSHGRWVFGIYLLPNNSSHFRMLVFCGLTTPASICMGSLYLSLAKIPRPPPLSFSMATLAVGEGANEGVFLTNKFYISYSNIKYIKHLHTDAGHRCPLLTYLVGRCNANVLLFDYRGWGLWIVFSCLCHGFPSYTQLLSVFGRWLLIGKRWFSSYGKSDGEFPSEEGLKKDADVGRRYIYMNKNHPILSIFIKMCWDIIVNSLTVQQAALSWVARKDGIAHNKIFLFGLLDYVPLCYTQQVVGLYICFFRFFTMFQAGPLEAPLLQTWPSVTPVPWVCCFLEESSIYIVFFVWTTNRHYHCC